MCLQHRQGIASRSSVNVWNEMFLSEKEDLEMLEGLAQS